MSTFTQAELDSFFGEEEEQTQEQVDQFYDEQSIPGNKTKRISTKKAKKKLSNIIQIF
jgi:hypothetical protein